MSKSKNKEPELVKFVAGMGEVLISLSKDIKREGFTKMKQKYVLKRSETLKDANDTNQFYIGIRGIKYHINNAREFDTPEEAIEYANTRFQGDEAKRWRPMAKYVVTEGEYQNYIKPITREFKPRHKASEEDIIVRTTIQKAFINKNFIYPDRGGSDWKPIWKVYKYKRRLEI